MAVHDEIVFPTDVDYGMTGGQEFNTTIGAGNTGYEARNQNWVNPRRRYEITAGQKSKAQHQTLLGFFNARKGKFRSFLLYDWSDFDVTGQSIGTGTGGALTLQLKKTYADAANPTDRTIKKPKNGTVKIYVNAVLQVEGVDYTVSYTLGTITFLVGHYPAGGAAVTADFEFYTPVRFDADKPDFVIEPGNIYTWNSVPMLEVLI
jgi:uncharacterized protein (TIGR02217 family)